MENFLPACACASFPFPFLFVSLALRVCFSIDNYRLVFFLLFFAIPIWKLKVCCFSESSYYCCCCCWTNDRQDERDNKLLLEEDLLQNMVFPESTLSSAKMNIFIGVSHTRYHTHTHSKSGRRNATMLEYIRAGSFFFVVSFTLMWNSNGFRSCYCCSYRYYCYYSRIQIVVSPLIVWYCRLLLHSHLTA